LVNEHNRWDLRFGILASVTYNGLFVIESSSDKATPHKFFPNLPEPEEPEETDPQVLAAMLKAWAASVNRTPEAN
jgi:hypothetical protein